MKRTTAHTKEFIKRLYGFEKIHRETAEASLKTFDFEMFLNEMDKVIHLVQRQNACLNLENLYDFSSFNSYAQKILESKTTLESKANSLRALLKDML